MEGLFRKKSIDKVSSPEQLNEYIRVASPGVWLVLSAITVFLVGIIIWSIFGTAETEIPAAINCTQESTVCFVSAKEGNKLKAGMKVSVDGKTGTVKNVFPKEVQMDDSTQPYILYAGGFEKGEYCFAAQVEIDGLEDGIFPGKITVNSVHPISFVLQ